MLLLGPPGAGKGTIAEALVRGAGVVHLSTGDMLREAVRQGSDVGRQAETFMKRGELVPDPVIVRMVEERFQVGAGGGTYLLDGFPRTLEQARLLEASLARQRALVNLAFLLEAPEELLIQRLTGRRTCRRCGANYHVTNIPPKRPGICDLCGSELQQRPDDREETIRKRLEVYRRETEPLIRYYERQGVLVRIDSSRPLADTVAELIRYLEPAAQES